MSRARRRRKLRAQTRYACRCRAIGGVACFASRASVRRLLKNLGPGVVIDPKIVLADRMARVPEMDGYREMWSGSNPS